MTLFGHFTYPISIHVSQSLTPKSGSQEVKNRVREKRCEFAACLVDGLCVLSRSLGRGGEGGLTPSFFTASAPQHTWLPPLRLLPISNDSHTLQYISKKRIYHIIICLKTEIVILPILALNSQIKSFLFFFKISFF